MTNQTYTYEIQAYGYEDTTHEVLTHTKKFTKQEFLQLLETARKKASYDTRILGNTPFDFFAVIGILKKEYGFTTSQHLTVDLGCNLEDKLEVLTND